MDVEAKSAAPEYAARLEIGWHRADWDEGALATIALLRDVAADRGLAELERAAIDLLRRCRVRAMLDAQR